MDVKAYLKRVCNVETIIALLITVILQLVMNVIIIYIFNDNATIAYLIVYAIIAIMICKHFLYEFKEFLIVAGIFVALSLLTYIYFAVCAAIGLNTNIAIMGITILLLVIEIIIGVLACKSKRYEQRKAYKANEKWLSTSAEQLNQLMKELVKLKGDVTDFDAASSNALILMDNDITELRNHIASLRETLNELYIKNVLHPNYQNWVAAATIYEYLDVGRCYELKGPYGAYNLYEKELLAHKILDSVSAINTSIIHYGSSIATTQKYIRRDLETCNRNIENLQIKTYGF